MPHDKISLNPNLGGWWVKGLTQDILQKFINKKEEKLPVYRQNVEGEQWLLLVIGGVGDSSYEMSDLSNDKESGFDRIYVLEDHNTRLYQLK